MSGGAPSRLDPPVPPPQRSDPRTDRGGLATGLLVLLTAIWGSTFFLIHDLVETIPPVDFLAVRFVVAAVLALALFGGSVRHLSRQDVLVAAGLGGVYSGAQILQTIGLVHTDASVSGFVTGTYVVLTPVFLAVVLRERIRASTWTAVALATGGLAVLSMQGWSIGPGEALTLGAAALYAVHIIGLARASAPSRVLGMSAVQLTVTAVLCALASAPGGVVWPSDPGQWLAVGYMASAAGVAAIWIQTWSQAHLSATRAAIVMTLEPVFAAGFAVTLGGEHPTWRMLAGGALVVAAMYVSELAGRRPNPASLPAEALHHEV